MSNRISLDLDHWHAKPAAGRNLFAGLDGIRGIAILLVVLAHSVPVLYMDSPLKKLMCLFCTNGTLGVWLFFVLSGFLISLPFFKRLHAEGSWCPPGYALRRAAKVIPPLYVSIILFALYAIAVTHTWTPIRGALETMAFFEIFRMPDPVITPIYWTLAAEVSFYAALPALFFFLRAPLKATPWLFPFFLIGGASALWLGVAHHPNFVAACPFVRDVLLSFMFFGWGSLFGILFLRSPGKPAAWSAFSLWAGAACFLACCAVSAHYWVEHQKVIDGMVPRLLLMNGAGFSAFLMLSVTHEPRTAAFRLLTNPALTLAGIVSYEWYLFHLIFISISNLITGEELHGDYWKLLIRLFFAFPVAFMFSAIFYRAFSLPILRWAHRPRPKDEKSGDGRKAQAKP